MGWGIFFGLLAIAVAIDGGLTNIARAIKAREREEILRVCEVG